MQVKGYRPEGLVPRTFWPANAVGSNRNSKAETKKLFPGVTPFDTPKPERLLQRVIYLATNPGDIVLDCFAGSGTTAAVAHKMGRRWITSELLPVTVDTYTKRRLTNLVNGGDSGGVTVAKERVTADGVSLPFGIGPHDAQKFQRVLRKVLWTADEVIDEDQADEAEAEYEDDLGMTDEHRGQESEPLLELTVSLDKELQNILRTATKAGTNPLDENETKAFNTLLGKVRTAQLATLDLTQTVRSSLLKRTQTKDRKTTLWHGGGGFTHLEVGPSMFEEADGVIVLADWATRGELAKAMSAQLEVRYEPNGIFSARKGSIRYVVIDGLVGAGTVAAVLEQVPSNEIVHVWATQYDDEAAENLRRSRPGSRLEAIPDSVLDSYRRKAAKGSPFGPRRDEQLTVIDENTEGA